MERAAAALGVLLALSMAACSRKSSAPTAPSQAPDPPEWRLVAPDLPAALMSVAGSSDHDIYAVGADKGDGPLVLHYDGSAWKEIHTGEHGDLWWVKVFPDGSALMSGAGSLVLRLEGGRVTRIPTPGLGRDTVYGVWGLSKDDFYAVGSASGRAGFVWHYTKGAFHPDAIPLDVPRQGVELPGFFKVWGHGDEVWVVGSAGSILHRRGSEPFTVFPSGTDGHLFTLHGTKDRWLAVGTTGVYGGGNGAVTDQSPPGKHVIQGVFVSDVDGDWLSGEQGMIFRRHGNEPFAPVVHGLPLPVLEEHAARGRSLHSIFVDSSHGVWSVGGDVLTAALDHGMILHYGQPVARVELESQRAPADKRATCRADVVAAGKGKSIARRWDEQALAAIRLDLPRPTVHARNLFHLSAAMWDVWSAYDAGPSEGVFVREKLRSPDVEAARAKAMSVAAYRILTHRYESAVGGAMDVTCFDAVMKDLGYSTGDRRDTGDDPVAFGNRVAKRVLDQTADDGSNESQDYKDPKPYVSPNPPLLYDSVGSALIEPDLWQRLNLSVAATQNGIILPAGEQTYIGSQWGSVTPFAMRRSSPKEPWVVVAPVPRVEDPAMRHRWLLEILRKTASVDPRDKSTIDISPGAYGHNSLGQNDGHGWAKNPVTGASYPPEVVPLADFARVMAEFWADGPRSETPPGHWNVLANQVADSPLFERKLFGKGPTLDPLSWDVHLYLALNGAVHDAAIAAWDAKRGALSGRPISWIRWMGGKGQSSDPKGPSYSQWGLPLVPGLVEVITKESSAPGERHEALAHFVGEIAVRGWPGEPGDRATQSSGVKWIRAVEWTPYQRRNFVTPAFPGYISGHSTFSRAGAEALTALTGSPYFPGGYNEFVAPASSFLTFERGPTTAVKLGWAAYADASDEAGQSRLWGGIHIEPDDFVGRKTGAKVGRDAAALAARYFVGDVPVGAKP